MDRQEFLSRFGVWPGKADDLLRLGKSLRRKRVFTTSIVIGATALVLAQDKASAHQGQQMLQSYVETKVKGDDGFWHFDIIPCVTVVFFTSGTSGTTLTSFPGWNNGNNSVECIGGGATGTGSHACGCCTSSGNGGGGGGYAKTVNTTLGSTFTYAVGAAGGTTQFNSVCTATGGSGTTGGAGTVGSTLRNGGAGATGATSRQGGGGGGAAGPGANGNAGSIGSIGAGGTGGSGDGGSGGAGGGSTVGGGTGNEYGTSHGSGGGGGGGNSTTVGGAGGQFGGGGGGGGTGSSGGAGFQGIIIVTYAALYVQRSPLKVYLRR
jgi:hypothetical protein